MWHHLWSQRCYLATRDLVKWEHHSFKVPRPDSALGQGLSCTATRSEAERINVCLHVKNTHTEIPWFISEIATTGGGSLCTAAFCPWCLHVSNCGHESSADTKTESSGLCHSSDHSTLLAFCDLLQAVTWCRTHIQCVFSFIINWVLFKTDFISRHLLTVTV